MSFQTNSVNFYAGLMEWDEFKVFYILFHIFISFVGPCLLYSIVWYERLSSHQMYRTMINLMLSHTCLISIARCFIVRIPYVIMLFYGPCSRTTCSIIIFLGRFFFLAVFTEILLWQLIKYFYIFQWKHMAALNDSFLATYVTICNLMLSAVFIATTHMMEYQNAELDYHICTGNHPHLNIIQSTFLESKLKKIDKPELSLEDLAGQDPLLFLTKLISCILLVITLKIFVYSKKEFYKKLLNKKETQTIAIINTPADIESSKYDGFLKTKNALIGASGSFTAVLLILILLVPSHISKSFAKNNADDINYGQGRVWTYVSRITLPILSYCVLPFVVITVNRKMRKTLAREITAKFSK